MRKGSRRQYGSQDFEKVDFAEVGRRVAGRRVVFSVDVAKERFVGSVVTQDEEVVSTIRWFHPAQTAGLVAAIVRLGAEPLEVVLEPSGTYGDPLRELFSRRGVAVFRVSPKRSHDAAEVYDGVPSWHDVKATGVLARLHLTGASERWRERTHQERDLTSALRMMATYDRHEAGNVSRLEALLARHWPEVLGMLSLTGATLVTLVEVFGGPARVASDATAARALMARVGGRWLAPSKITEVTASAVQTIGLPMTDGELASMRELAAEILRCRAASRRWKSKVRALATSNAAAQRMAPVVGDITAAVVVGLLGDPRSYSSARSLLKSAGVNLREKSSGKHTGELKLTKRGPSEVRFYLYLAALRLVMRDPVIRAWYQRKVARDGGRYKNRAVVAVMRKVLRALWHVARGAAFDSTMLFDTSRLAPSR